MSNPVKKHKGLKKARPKKNKAFQYRLYPNKPQEQMLLQWCGNNRFLWNYMLDINIKEHKVSGMFLFFQDLCKLLPPLKRDDFHWLSLSPAQSLQQTCKQLDQALKNCFKSGFGFPKFKSKNKSNPSLSLPQGFDVTNDKHLVIPKLGSINWKKHRPIKGSPKNVTIRRTKAGNWYVSVCCELFIKNLPKTGSTIGLDLGVKRLATTSDNRFKKAFDSTTIDFKIKSCQRKLARQRTENNKTKRLKIKELKISLKKAKIVREVIEIKSKIQDVKYHKSKRYLKILKILRKLNERKTNKKKDYLNKYSTYLVKSHDLIVVEDLSLKNMTKTAKGTLENPGKNVKQKSGLNRVILNQNWGMFLSMLSYKCSWYDKTLIRVDPKYTSQTCSKCHKKDKKSRVSQSKFKCTSCGFKINADQNASRNIKNKWPGTGLHQVSPQDG